VVVNHDEATSLTASRILLSGGVLTESADNNGITNLMTRMLLKGNQMMNADEISERLEFLGVSYSVSCYRDYSTISFQCLSEYFDEVFEIIAASLVNPIFPEEELARLKTEMEGEIKAEDDYQPQASSKLFWKTIYGNEGYGLPTNGTLESIQSIDIQDIKDHYHNYVGGNNLIVSVVSDLEPNRIVLKIENELKSLKQQANQIPKPSLALQTEKTGFISYDRNQSFIYMGIVLDRLNPEEVPYTILLNEIMGGSVSARLWYLRQKEKLAYAIYTQFAFDKYDAIFRAAIGTDTAKVEQALNSLDREWNKMVSDGITDAELMDAKINMKNNLFYWIDRKRNRANNIANLEYLGYGYHFVQDLINAADKVELAEINRFISEKFSDDRRYVSIVGKK
jgi:zinc protease